MIVGSLCCQEDRNAEHRWAGMLIISAGFFAIAIQAAFRGWLPNGPNGFKRGKGVYRHESPIVFWFFFYLYVGAGLVGVVHALRLLAGDVPG